MDGGVVGQVDVGPGGDVVEGCAVFGEAGTDGVDGLGVGGDDEDAGRGVGWVGRVGIAEGKRIVGCGRVAEGDVGGDLVGEVGDGEVGDAFEDGEFLAGGCGFSRGRQRSGRGEEARVEVGWQDGIGVISGIVVHWVPPFGWCVHVKRRLMNL